MIKLTILYGQPNDSEAFEQYYTGTHLPIAAKLTGVQRLELTRFGTGPDGAKPAYHRMAELYFPDEGQLQTTLGSPEAEAVIADIPNFATGGVTMLTGSIAE